MTQRAQRQSPAADSATNGPIELDMDEPTPDGHERVLDWAQQLLANNREELRRADAKASQALGAAGAAALTLLTVVVGGSWSPASLNGAFQWSWWLGCAFWIASVTTLAFALLPRLGGRGNTEQLAYFGDIHRIRRRGDIGRAFEEAAQDPLPGVTSQLSWTSGAVMTKYRLVRCGVVCFLLATTFVILTFA